MHKSTRTVLKGHLKNASRQYKRVVHRFGFALSLWLTSQEFVFDFRCFLKATLSKKNNENGDQTSNTRKVPTSHHMFEENAETVRLPFLKPSDMLKHLLVQEPWLLLGGMHPGAAACEMLATFWRLYRREHPSHVIFSEEFTGQIGLDHTIPIMLHGDGGRTAKKQPLEVYSLIPVLGLDTFQKRMQCRCSSRQTYSGQNLRDPMAQRLNNRNNSYLTHFLLFAFPSKHYKKTPGLLKEMLKEISRDLATCLTHGIASGDSQVWRFAVIGSRGDAEWHSKTGILSRSYQNVGHRNQLQCCHECLAGDALYPFEDFRSTANWQDTVYTTPPWHEEPPFSPLPFEVAGWNSGAAARFFRRDPFHVFRLGIARNFFASCLVSLCLDGHFDAPGDTVNITDRLRRAWGMFSLWLAANKFSVSGVRSFSKEKLHFPNMNSFPFIGCKGSDTIVLLRWLKFVAGLKNQPLMKQAAEHGLEFQAIHGHGMWLKPGCRQGVERSCRMFLDCYARLAAHAFQQRRTLFGMVPKAHAFAHVYHDLHLSRDQEYTLNPAVWDCSMSEDFVGRVARQSRRISYKQVVENTVLAYKVRANLTIQRFKKIRRL